MKDDHSIAERARRMQRLNYDMTSIWARQPLMIWVNGQMCSGIATITEMICRHFGFDAIDLELLVAEEIKMDTDRSKLIHECIIKQEDIPETFITDLIKEALLRANRKNHGYVMARFPQNKKQATMFVKEIKNVNIIFFLYADLANIMDRMRAFRNVGRIDNIKKEMIQTKKKLLKVFKDYSKELEKVETNDEPDQVFLVVQQAILNRINMRSETQSLTEDEETKTESTESKEKRKSEELSEKKDVSSSKMSSLKIKLSKQHVKDEEKPSTSA